MIAVRFFLAILQQCHVKNKLHIDQIINGNVWFVLDQHAYDFIVMCYLTEIRFVAPLGHIILLPEPIGCSYSFPLMKRAGSDLDSNPRYTVLETCHSCHYITDGEIVLVNGTNEKKNPIYLVISKNRKIVERGKKR